METWDTEALVKWLKDEVNLGDSKTINAVEDHSLTGEQLLNMELDELETIIPSKARCSCIIEEKNEYIKRLTETPENKASDKMAANENNQSQLEQSFRKFNSPVDITDQYQQHSNFPPTPSRPTNLIEPIHRFVPLENVSLTDSSFKTLTKEVITFGAACLNDGTNGVIHFGVRDGQILGLSIQCDKSSIDEKLTQKIRKAFHESQVRKVLKCIRPMQWVQVRTLEGPAKRYVIEIDIEPESDLCGEEVFLVRPKTDLYTFSGKDPCVVDKDKCYEFFIEKPNLAAYRKKKESFKRMEASCGAHKQDLVNVLCGGMPRFREGQYPILVLPPADSSLSPEMIESKFSFLKYIEWKAVFDFGADRTFLDYMNSQERLFKIRDVEEFDTENEDATAVKNTKEDAYNGHVPNWILMNGDSTRNRQPKHLTHWKKYSEDACRECFRTYTKGFKISRVLIVFLLHSQSSDVFVDACVQLCVQSENYACIAENENVAKTWQAGVMRYQYINKEDVKKRIVAGLPWEFVGETVREITDNEPNAMCKVPTSIGDQILGIRKELYDLSVVGSNECDNNKIIENAEKLDEFLKIKEAEFYKGGKVGWWNFWSDGVCTRDAFKPLCNKIRHALQEEGVEGEIEQGIRTHILYHQPGSGGTTCARHVLWEFRKEVKCAEIVHFTDSTCSQIVKLREFGESIAKDPGPVLLLIDNADQDKTLELLTNLKRQSEMRDRHATKRAYCVCLIVNRRSNISGKFEQHECLRQHLSRHERVLFEKQSSKIEEKHAIHTLIAFNIMKANFDADFIRENVACLIKDITSVEELFLLKYLAFINVYDISQKGVECAAFDEVLAVNAEPHWVEYLSDALGVLVIRDKCDSGHRVIKISHHKLAEQILENMQGKTLLSEFAIKLISHRFLKNKVSFATLNLRRHLAGIVKQRDTNAKGHRERFAPLILQITKQESWQVAATVMEKVYQLTDDAFVAQQLARLYNDFESWESAEAYASMATQKYPDNYHLLDTKGQVYRSKLEKNYKMYEPVVDRSMITASFILDKVEEAYQARTIFKGVQSLSHTLCTKSPTAKPTTSGQLGLLQIYASILENMTLLPVFEDLPSGNTGRLLMKFLHDPDYVPQEIATWSENSSYDYISFLKSIPHETKETLRYVEDFHSHLNQGFIKSKDSDFEEAIKREKKAVSSLKNRLYKFILNTDNEDGDKRLASAADAIWLLGGTSFNNILQSLRLEPNWPLRSISDEQQSDQEWVLDCTSVLRSILHKARQCIQLKPNNFEALECLISASLIVSLYFRATDLAETVLYTDLLSWSKTLYAIRNSKPMRLEPYLYYVILHWPKAGAAGHRSISEAISSWRELYLRKNPNMLANHAFYLTQETGLQSLAHRSQLYNHKKHRGDNFWKDENVKRVLKRFTGTLDGSGSVVYLTDESTKETILEIPCAYHIHDSSLWRNAVTFPIAFTFMGPKAYDVQRK